MDQQQHGRYRSQGHAAGATNGEQPRRFWCSKRVDIGSIWNAPSRQRNGGISLPIERKYVYATDSMYSEAPLRGVRSRFCMPEDRNLGRAVIPVSDSPCHNTLSQEFGLKAVQAYVRGCIDAEIPCSTDPQFPLNLNNIPVQSVAVLLTGNLTEITSSYVFRYLGRIICLPGLLVKAKTREKLESFAKAQTTSTLTAAPALNLDQFKCHSFAWRRESICHLCRK